MSEKVKELEVISRGKQHKFVVGDGIDSIFEYNGENKIFIVHYATTDKMVIFKNPFVINKK